MRILTALLFCSTLLLAKGPYNETLFDFSLWEGAYLKTGVDYFDTANSPNYLYRVEIGPTFYNGLAFAYAYAQNFLDQKPSSGALYNHALNLRVSGPAFQILHSGFNFAIGYGLLSANSTDDDFAFTNIGIDMVLNILFDLKLVTSVSYQSAFGLAYNARFNDASYSGGTIGLHLVYGVY